jgi:hypothetical protein
MKRGRPELLLVQSQLVMYTGTIDLVGIDQCCQIVYFQTKIPNLGKFWLVLQLKNLVHFMAIGRTAFQAPTC